MMQFFFEAAGKSVVITARLEDDDGNIGDFRTQITAGQSFYGYSYAELFNKQQGALEIDEKG